MGKNPKVNLIHLSPAKLRLLRIFEIDRHVRSGSYPNATNLAPLLEVHPRTVHRDIEFLRVVLGAPIEYDPLRRGWRYTETGFSLKHLELPKRDQEALESARIYLARLVASSLGEDVDKIFEKLADVHPDSIGALRTQEGLKPHAPSPLDASASDAPQIGVSLLFRGTAASSVVRETWHKSQTLEILSDDRVRLQMSIPMCPALERWVLGWGDEVIVESPDELAAVIVGRQRRALRRHERAKKQPSTEASDDARGRDQFPLDFETELLDRPDDTSRRPLPPNVKAEVPVQSDFGFKGRSSKRKRRKKP